MDSPDFGDYSIKDTSIEIMVGSISINHKENLVCLHLRKKTFFNKKNNNSNNRRNKITIFLKKKVHIVTIAMVFRYTTLRISMGISCIHVS